MNLSDFLKIINQRVNKSVIIRSCIFGVLIFAVLAILIAEYFIYKGYSVPGWVYLVALLGGVAVGWYRYSIDNLSEKKTASFADRFFNLKDGIVSSLHLKRQKEHSFNKAQSKWTEERIADCDPQSIPISYPKSLAAMAGILCLGALSLSFIPVSEVVKQRLINEEITEERSEEAVEKIKEVIEEIDQDLTEDEREHMNMESLRQMVDTLEPTKDQKEAARQFAKLEQKARELSKSLQQERDEQTMENAVEELKKSSQQGTKELAEKMKNNEIKKANEHLKKLMPKALPKKLTQKDLQAAKEQIEKLREVSKRLANANAQASSAESGNAKSGQASLGEAMSQMDANARELTKKLKELELAEMRQSQNDKPNQQNCENFNDELGKLCKSCDNLSDKLSQCLAKKSSKMRLDSLCKNLSQCQSFSNKQCNSLSLSQCQGIKPGGKKAGSGANDARQAPGAELSVIGNQDQLSGQKGQGPSMSKVEEAESGAGVSSNRVTAQAQDFARQVESFVERDDVPEELKQGVKEYFKTVHQTE